MKVKELLDLLKGVNPDIDVEILHQGDESEEWISLTNNFDFFYDSIRPTLILHSEAYDRSHEDDEK